MFFINYNIREIIHLYLKQGGIFSNDDISEISGLLEKSQPLSSASEQSSSEVDDTLASFEDIMNLTQDEFSLAEKKEIAEPKKIILPSEFQKQEALMNIRKKEQEKHGYKKPIQRSGFIEYENYIDKMKMMDTPLFLFGMKLNRQLLNVEFFDADFCNTLLIQSESFTDQSLGDCC